MVILQAEVGSITISLDSTYLKVSPILDLTGAYCYPNPAKAGKGITFVGLPHGTKIRIFSITGEKIYEVDNFDKNPYWDLCNDAGEKVASGIYIYYLTDGKSINKGKLGVIK